MEDLTLRRLTKKVFPYLWVRHKLMSSVPSTGIFSFSEMTVFSQGIGNAVVVYLHMYRPTLSSYMEKHIPSMPQSKIHFWTHVAFLCLQVRLKKDNVFDYFLTACAITAEVALHCYMNGYDDVLSLASVFFCAFFENELYEGFHKSGGWRGLHRYIEDTSCKELYELVGVHIKDLSSPSDYLPILITIQHEQLAAERREKFISLRSLKIGEIEREDQTTMLVSRIFHWYFMENHRILESKHGILKRTENIRHGKKKSNLTIDEGRHDETSEAKEIRQHDESKPSESVITMSETRFSCKAIQTSDDSEWTKVRKEGEIQMCTNNETSEKIQFTSSSSLSELRNFYESLSTSFERKGDESKIFRNKTTEQGKGLKSSAIQEVANRNEQINHFPERYQKTFPYSSENGGSFPKLKKCTPETEIKANESFSDDMLSEFTKSFQELGFKCLYVGNSSYLQEKSANFENYAEVVKKCRHFQNKFSSMQFVILIPSNCFKNGISHAVEAEKCDEFFSKNNYEKQSSNIAKENYNDCTASPQKPLSETEKTKFQTTKVDRNHFGLANELGLLQNCTTENIHKSRFVITKVKESDLLPIGETSKISRFSVTKVNENQTILKDETNLLEGKCIIEPITASRFRVSKVRENQLKDGTGVFGKNWTDEKTKISKFTVTKVNENQSRDGTSILGKNWKNGTTKISRFTVTKVDENQPGVGMNMLRKHWTNGTTKISRFAVRKVDENHPNLRDKMNLLRKSYPNNTTKISRFAVARVGEKETGFSERNFTISGEISGDTENETVHFHDNGSVKYQKRVSFSEHHFISYYQTYSSDESSNSITSRESLNKNSPEETHSSLNSGHTDNQEDPLHPLTPNHPTVAERRRLFHRFSSGESRSSSDNAGNSNMSSGSGFFNRIFRRSTSSNKLVESPTENKKEPDEQKIELRKSLDVEGIENPVVFKI